MNSLLIVLFAGLVNSHALSAPHKTIPDGTPTPGGTRKTVTFLSGGTPTACPCVDMSRSDCGIKRYTRTKTSLQVEGCPTSFNPTNCPWPRCVAPSATVSVSIPNIECPAIQTTTSWRPCRTKCPPMSELCARTTTITYQVTTGADAKPTAVTIWD
jgi:hypothetical protein